MIDEFSKTRKLPQYRINQFMSAYYTEKISSFDELTTWPKSLREDIKKEIPFSTLEEISHLVSKDKGTEKVLFQCIASKKLIETVLMRHNDGRNTVCVSCMVGCPMACTFCATGKMGFQGSLSAREIVDQILFFARKLKTINESVTNVVFMGMGEPLMNLIAVIETIRILTDPNKLAMSPRRITVSTSGVTPNLKKLLESGYKGRLALSLHAPNQPLREKIMPLTSKYPLPELLSVLHNFATETNKRVSYEYILIDGVNDSVSQAKELVDVLGTHLVHVNLIPCNPVPGTTYQRSKPNAIKAFSEVLERYGLQHTVRVTMGDDIQAACGQLASTEQTRDTQQ